MFNLAMALLWLVPGALCYFLAAHHPESAGSTSRGTLRSLGWRVLALVLY